MTRVLVIKHSAFGDFIQAMGCFKAIRQHHPDAHITLMTTKPYEALARASGYFNDIYIDSRPKWYDVPGWLRLKRWLNAQQFTQGYDLQNSERTCLYYRLFLVEPQWSGIVTGASQAITDDAARKAKHVFTALVDQLRLAGIEGVTPDDLAWIKADVSSFALPSKYALVVAGCSAKHAAKRWPEGRYAEICQWFVGQGVTPVLIGTDTERDVTAYIKAACPDAIDLTGQTDSSQIAVLARGAVCAVGNDTGPIHMIAPTGCKTLALYPGFSNPKRHGPLGAHVKTIQENTMADIEVDAVKRVLAALV